MQNANFAVEIWSSGRYPMLPKLIWHDIRFIIGTSTRQTVTPLELTFKRKREREKCAAVNIFIIILYHTLNISINTYCPD